MTAASQTRSKKAKQPSIAKAEKKKVMTKTEEAVMMTKAANFLRMEQRSTVRQSSGTRC